MKAQKQIKLDGRRMNSYQKKTNGKGVGIVIHGKIKSERDLGLQKRIDTVVEMAMAHEIDHNTDAINSYRHVARSTLHAHRVG